MNDLFVSISEQLPRLDSNNETFDIDGQLPDEYVIELTTTLQALRKVKTNKATGPDKYRAWILKNHANILTLRVNVASHLYCLVFYMRVCIVYVNTTLWSCK